MYVGKCEYCGAEIVSQYKSKAGRFCGSSCRKMFEKSGRTLIGADDLKIATNGEYICPHNCKVTCKERNCSKCGWNPTVAKDRLNHIAEELAERCANV